MTELLLFYHQRTTTQINQQRSLSKFSPISTWTENSSGAKKELEKLNNLLQGDNRYITIHGFGGIGKTALALQAVQNFDSSKVLALSLVGTPRLNQVILKIARFLNVDIKDLEPQDQQSEIFQTLASEGAILLYLDNMEDIKHSIEDQDLDKKEEARALMLFFRRMPRSVKILATSRIALSWPNEELVELDGLTPYEGMQVFRQWISHRRNDMDDDSGMKLSRQIYGHPLSLRLLGGVFNNCKQPIDQFIDNIDERLRKAVDPESVNVRHESIRVCLKYSFDYLDVTLRSFLGKLKEFEIPFTATLVTRALNHSTTLSLASSEEISVADNLHKLWQHSWLNQYIYEENPILGDWRPRIIERDPEFYILHPRLRDFLIDKFYHYESANRDMLNDSEIQFYTALCYGVGFGVVNDLEKQIEWCTKSAENGYLEAQLTLATCYEQGGCGVEKNQEKAFYWYLKAAEAGDKGAQRQVESRYWEGIGVQKNSERGGYWFDRYLENETEPLEMKFDLSLSLLHRAAERGKMEVVRSLVEQLKATVDLKDRFGQTPLHRAAAGGYVEIVKLLVAKYRADVNAEAENGQKPLHHAAKGGYIEVVGLLVANFGADGNAKDKNGWTPLHWAAEIGHIEVVVLLLAKFDVDANAEAEDGGTPLHRAAEGGHVEIVRLLVAEFGADVDAKAEFGVTSLHLAAERGHVEVVMLLVAEFGADTNIKDEHDGRTPLLRAAESGHVEIVKILLAESVADTNAEVEFGLTPLQQAAEGGHIGIVKLLAAEYRAKANVQNEHNSRTSLHRAAEGGHVEIVRLLITEFGADPNAQSEYDARTPLHKAAERGHIDVMRLLVVEFGADVNAKDNYGWTPLHRAAEGGHIEIVKLLVAEFGADSKAKVGNGWTPLHLAAAGGHSDIVRLLVAEFGANVNARAKNRRTPLHRAAVGGHIHVVRLLVIEFGADANAEDKNGRTPLHLAAQVRRVQVVRLFKEFGLVNARV